MKLLIISLSIFISACSFKKGYLYSESSIQQSNDMANVVVYRISQFTGSAVLTPVYINGEKQDFMLSTGSFQMLKLNPGNYVFNAEPGNWMTPIARQTEVSFSAGGEYFMRFKTDNRLVVMFDHFEIIPKENAINELKSMKMSLEK